MARRNDQKDNLTVSAKATSAITTTGFVVRFDTDEDYFVVAGVGEDFVGVLTTKAAADEELPIVYSGIVPARLAGTIADKGYAETASTGALVAATGLRPIVGYLPCGGASGELRSVWLGKRPHAPIVGADVASAAAIVPTGEFFTVTGTTTVTSITSTGILAGSVITIMFSGVLTFTDGSNLLLASDYTTSANDTITLRYNGTNWVELCRSGAI